MKKLLSWLWPAPDRGNDDFLEEMRKHRSQQKKLTVLHYCAMFVLADGKTRVCDGFITIDWQLHSFDDQKKLRANIQMLHEPGVEPIILSLTKLHERAEPT